MQVQTPSRPADRIPRLKLWFGLCAGAVAWAVESFTSFMIAAQACSDGRGSLGPLSPGAVRILLGAITLALLAVAAAGALISYRNWRSLSERRKLTEAEGLGRENFMSLIGVFVGVVFVLGIIWAGIPPVLIDVCINAR